MGGSFLHKQGDGSKDAESKADAESKGTGPLLHEKLKQRFRPHSFCWQISV